jgi:hypothetical protein
MARAPATEPSTEASGAERPNRICIRKALILRVFSRAPVSATSGPEPASAEPALLVANRRAKRSASTVDSCGKHKAESGHLRSAVDIAVVPLKQPRQICPELGGWVLVS